VERKEEFYKRISDVLVDLDEEQVLTLTQRGLEQGLDPLEILERGLSDGIRRIGDSYAAGNITLPHMVICADIMQRAVLILEPEIEKSQKKRRFKGKVIIGTVEGDIHDIGKKIVATLLKANGYEVIDLGRDVPNTKFVEQVRLENPQFLCLSALMTTTVVNQKAVIELLEMEFLRDRVRVIVGGAGVTRERASEMGADGYGENASEGVSVMEEFLSG
jgi:corrinoid protein of di/trimethylamine methyltransferase